MRQVPLVLALRELGLWLAAILLAVLIAVPACLIGLMIAPPLYALACLFGIGFIAQELHRRWTRRGWTAERRPLWEKRAGGLLAPSNGWYVEASSPHDVVERLLQVTRRA